MTPFSPGFRPAALFTSALVCLGLSFLATSAPAQLTERTRVVGNQTITTTTGRVNGEWVNLREVTRESGSTRQSTTTGTIGGERVTLRARESTLGSTRINRQSGTIGQQRLNISTRTSTLGTTYQRSTTTGQVGEHRISTQTTNRTTSQSRSYRTTTGRIGDQSLQFRTSETIQRQPTRTTSTRTARSTIQIRQGQPLATSSQSRGKDAEKTKRPSVVWIPLVNTQVYRPAPVATPTPRPTPVANRNTSGRTGVSRFDSSGRQTQSTGTRTTIRPQGSNTQTPQVRVVTPTPFPRAVRPRR